MAVQINSVYTGHLTLAELPLFTKARVCSLANTSGKDLQKLLAFGVLPGQSVEVIQRYPAIVVRVGRTTIALDNQIASKVLVRA